MFEWLTGKYTAPQNSWF